MLDKINLKTINKKNYILLFLLWIWNVVINWRFGFEAFIPYAPMLAIVISLVALLNKKWTINKTLTRVCYVLLFLACFHQ